MYFPISRMEVKIEKRNTTNKKTSRVKKNSPDSENLLPQERTHFGAKNKTKYAYSLVMLLIIKIRRI